MKKPFRKIDAGNFETSGFQVYPTEGYTFPKNETTGKAFPYCCEFHQSIYECLKKKYKEKKYQDIPDKVINQLSYTEHCITQNIDKPNWYKVITDYIEYNYYSFGHPLPIHAVSLYLRNVQSVIESPGLDIDKNKQQKLLEFIERYYQPDPHPEIDLNVLYSIYQEWLQIFPFGLNSYFGTLKQHFEKQLPFITGKPEENIYLGWVKVKVHTKESLIEALTALTKALLGKIKAPELIEKGIISDINRHRLELANESLKIRTAQIIKNFSEGELQYINMLKGWLQLHKDYFNEIAPLLQTNTPKQLPPQPQQQAPEIKEFPHYQVHKNGLVNVLRMPEPIRIAYSRLEHKYIEIEGFGLFPVSGFALMSLKTDVNELPLKEYAKGFLAGYNSDLRTYIDTPESRIEIIAKLGFEGDKGFKATYKDNGAYEYTEKDVFERGVYEGKRYKAWEIILETPWLFIKYSPFQNTETKAETELQPKPDLQTPIIKPIFKPEAIPTILDLLKDFFSPEHQIQLKQILETGNNANEKLLFRDNGNRLTDTFKKLIEFDFITGCQKQGLQKWIIQNFTFLKKGKVSSFNPETVEKSISRNTSPCKSPIIEIKNGEIKKAEQPRQKQYNNY